MVNDVRRAYFYAAATREVYVTIPEEDREEGDEARVGRLQLSMYGTRDAARNWQATYTEHLKKIGFTQGRSSPCVFKHKERDLLTMVHGDD